MTDAPMPYCGPAPVPGDLWSSWNLDPILIAGLAVFGVVLFRRAGPGDRGMAAVAMAGLIAAFVSPLCALTAALFSARSAHHLILITAVAPALAVAWPIARRIPARLSLAALSVAMIAWHLPSVYAAMWGSDLIYWLLQAAMLLPAWAFWSKVLARGASSSEALSGALMVGSLAGVMGLLGAVLTFAPGLLYLQHVDGAIAWGMTPLADQQLAGLIMWVPGFVPLAALAGLMLRRGWLAETRA